MYRHNIEVWAMSETDPLKNKFWNCPKCGRLNLGAWCPCEREGGQVSNLLTCANCAYEIDEASKIGLCDNCQRAYELGEREGAR